MNSLIFYISMFFISGMFANSVRKKYKNNASKLSIILSTIIALGIPIAISSLRYKVGTDFTTYESLYEASCILPMTQIFKTNIEVTFVIISKIAYIFNNVQIMFFIYALLTVLFMWFSFLNKKEKISIALIYILYLFLNFTSSFNTIRQALAVAIIACSYKYICEKNFIKFFIFVIIAGMFHITALFFIPFYFIFQKNNFTKLSKLIRVMCIILILIIIMNFEVIFSIITSYSIFEKFSEYMNYELETRNLMIIVKVIVLCFVTLYRKKLIRYDNDNEIYYFMLIIDLIINILGFRSPYLKRIGSYFYVSQLFLLSAIPKVIENKKEKMFVTFGIILYAISMFVITTYILDQADIIPYTTIFSKEIV